MRIVSKFKDYYDFAMSFAMDKSVVYMRKTEGLPFPLPKKMSPPRTLYSHRNIFSGETS